MFNKVICKHMTPKKADDQFNEWCRGDDEDTPQPASHKITAAIDEALKYEAPKTEGAEE